MFGKFYPLNSPSLRLQQRHIFQTASAAKNISNHINDKKARLVWFIGSPRAQITSQMLFRPQPEAWHTAGGSPGKAPDLTPLSSRLLLCLSSQSVSHIVREWTERGSRSESRRVIPRLSRVCLWWESGCPVIYCLILTALQPWCHLLSTPAEPSTQAHETLPKAVMSQRSACLVALPGRGSTVHVQWAVENRRSSVWAVERGMKTHPDESKNGLRI